MHELPWIPILGSWVRRFANDFREWWSHEWKLLANRLTSDQKIVIHVNECIILFLACYFMSWTHNSAINNYRSLVLPLSLRTVFSDLVLWRQHSWSVTSHERMYWHCNVIFVHCCRFWLSIVTSAQLICDVTLTYVLALWRHIPRLLLHVQIGAEAFFTSE